ncbi:hypothetical protein ASF20_04570 [Methylobacterium sp. Leaf88]|nr:hypothetical protein ASF20_04570 [Methylobacterium sp. Leaf88]
MIHRNMDLSDLLKGFSTTQLSCLELPTTDAEIAANKLLGNREDARDLRVLETWVVVAEPEHASLYVQVMATTIILEASQGETGLYNRRAAFFGFHFFRSRRPPLGNPRLPLGAYDIEGVLALTFRRNVLAEALCYDPRHEMMTVVRPSSRDVEEVHLSQDSAHLDPADAVSVS